MAASPAGGSPSIPNLPNIKPCIHFKEEVPLCRLVSPPNQMYSMTIRITNEFLEELTASPFS